MKIVINPMKPRNPLVLRARMRRAGSHRAGGRSVRQQANSALKREIARISSDRVPRSP